jgi:hypothetical protein
MISGRGGIPFFFTFPRIARSLAVVLAPPKLAVAWPWMMASTLLISVWLAVWTVVDVLVAVVVGLADGETIGETDGEGDTVSLGLGDGSVGVGDGSVGVGDGSVGVGDGSVGVGDGSVGVGDGSVGVGDGSVGEGELSVGVGEGSVWAKVGLPSIARWTVNRADSSKATEKVLLRRSKLLADRRLRCRPLISAPPLSGLSACIPASDANRPVADAHPDFGAIT